MVDHQKYIGGRAPNKSRYAKYLSRLIRLITDELLRVDRSDDQQSHLILDQVDIELAQLAIDQGVGGLLYQLITRGITESVGVRSRAVLDRLEAEWLKRSAAAMLRGAILQAAWPIDSDPPLLIKGADLEERVYPNRGFSGALRSCSDWDILLPPGRFEEVSQSWEASYGEPIEPRSARLSHEQPYELGYYINGLLFELHRAPCPRFFNALVTGEGIYERSEVYRSSWGQVMRAPSLKDRLLIWLINFAKSGGSTRLVDWVDLSVILREIHDDGLSLASLDSYTEQFNLRSAWRDASFILCDSALIEALPTAYREDQDQARGEDQLLLESLYRFAEPWQIGCHQIKYCAPQQRVGYVHRALLRSLGER